jgi:hypothetical protein
VEEIAAKYMREKNGVTVWIYNSYPHEVTGRHSIAEVDFLQKNKNTGWPHKKSWISQLAKIGKTFFVFFHVFQVVEHTPDNTE